MNKISRMTFLKQSGRWSVLAGLVGFGTVLLTRDKKGACHSRCGQCASYENGKCGLGLK